MRIILAILGLLLVHTPGVGAQDTGKVPFTSDRWVMEGDDIQHVVFRGREALRLQGASAYLEDADFRNGTIEFDMAFPHSQGFHGVGYRMESRQNYEEFYFRSHLSGMPDANQYNPVFGGISAWQLLHGEQFNHPTTYPAREWIHVRLVVQGDSAEVYVDSDEPELTWRMVDAAEKGGLFVWASDLNPVYFSNFSYRKGRETIRGQAAEFDELPLGTVMNWRVSNPVSESEFTDADMLDTNLISDRNWNSLDVEENGVVNLARVRQGDANTVVGRITINSDKARKVTIRFGYSDRVRVYLNGRLLYTGNNGYRTRDYRYLGTIGLFDELSLDLEDGRNIIDFVVSEDFGGWGLTAQFPDTSGLDFEGSVIRE